MLDDLISTIRDIQVGDFSGNLTAETTFEEMGLDSLDMTELVVEVEEHYDITINDDDMNRLKTIGDLSAFIEKKKQ